MCTKPAKSVFKTSEWRRTDVKPQGCLWHFFTTCVSAEIRTIYFWFSVLYCLSRGYPDCGTHPKEAAAILPLALIVSGSGRANLFGWIWRLVLSSLTQKTAFMLLIIVTDLCICMEYVEHTKCFISIPKSQNVDLNHLLLPSVLFYLCQFFSRTETLTSRHRAASSVSSHFSSAISPEWILLICKNFNSTEGFLFSYSPIQRKG